MEQRTFIISSQNNAASVARIIEKLGANGVLKVTISEHDARTIKQNAMLHGVLGDIAKQLEWCGKKWPVVVWKRLVTYAYLREINESPLLIPALDGNGMDIIYERTSRMSRKKVEGLIEWCYAFGAQHGITTRS